MVLLGEEIRGASSRQPIKYGRTYYPSQVILSQMISQVASRAADLPFDRAFPFPDDPLAYVG